MRGPLLLAVGAIVCTFSTVRADEANPTLDDVHKTLLQAAGYQADVPPTVAEETALLQTALRMISHIPHVYHGDLKAASRSINAALDELGAGDPADKARGDIFDADDRIKAIM